MIAMIAYFPEEDKGAGVGVSARQSGGSRWPAVNASTGLVSARPARWLPCLTVLEGRVQEAQGLPAGVAPHCAADQTRADAFRNAAGRGVAADSHDRPHGWGVYSPGQESHLTSGQLRSAINRLTSAPALCRSSGSEVTVAVKIEIDLCRRAVYNRVHTPPTAGPMRRLENPLRSRRVVHGGTLPMAQGRCFPHSVLGPYRPGDLCPRAGAHLLRALMGLCRARCGDPDGGRLQAHLHR
jgi:hypothetical protein